METKYCHRCKKMKPIDNFNNSKKTKDGKQCKCRECQHKLYLGYKVRCYELGKKWREENRERHLNNRRKYYQKNRRQWDNYYRENKDDILEAMKLYKKEHEEKVKKRRREWHKNKRNIDIGYILNINISNGIRKSLRGNKNGKHWESLVGYDGDILKKHLTKTMPKGYIWQDYFEGRLHIDHKIPRSVFNFSKSEHIDFKRCWALSNLQLLPAKENIRKKAKLTEPFQPSLEL